MPTTLLGQSLSVLHCANFTVRSESWCSSLANFSFRSESHSFTWCQLHCYINLAVIHCANFTVRSVSQFYIEPAALLIFLTVITTSMLDAKECFHGFSLSRGLTKITPLLLFQLCNCTVGESPVSLVRHISIINVNIRTC